MNKKNPNNNLIHFHAQLLIEFHQGWRIVKDMSDEVKERERIAYYLLEHAANLYRFTCDKNIPRHLLEKPRNERRLLVMSACDYFDFNNLAKQVVALYDDPEFEEEDYNLLVDAVMNLDSASEVLWWGRALSRDIYAAGLDRELATAFAHATTELEVLNNALCAWGDSLLPVLTELEGVRQLIRTPIREEAWWFRQNAWEALERLNARIYEEMKRVLSTSRRGKILDWFAKLFTAMPEPAALQLAAAHSGPSLRLRVSGKADLVVNVILESKEALRFEVYNPKTRKAPAWINRARLELWMEKNLVRAWEFYGTSGSLSIPKSELVKGTDLILKTDQHEWQLSPAE